MSVASFLNVDMESEALQKWQLMHTLATGTTSLLTTAQLTLGVIPLTTHFPLDVSTLGKIRLQVWGVASDGNAPVIQFYGWNEGGPGFHIGQITATMGNFTSLATTGWHAVPSTHASVRAELLAGTAYRGCDAYVIAADFESAVTTHGTPEANFPSVGFDIDFATNQYKWLGATISSLGSATSAAVVFKVLSIKSGYSTPQFTS